MEEMETERQLLATVKKRKLQYFDHIIRAQTLCAHILKQWKADKRTVEKTLDGQH